jgi:hypothetical protein
MKCNTVISKYCEQLVLSAARKLQQNHMAASVHLSYCYTTFDFKGSIYFKNNCGLYKRIIHVIVPFTLFPSYLLSHNKIRKPATRTTMLVTNFQHYEIGWWVYQSFNIISEIA